MITDTYDKMNIEEIRLYSPEIVGEMSFTPPTLDMNKIAEKRNNVRVAYDVNKKTAEVAKRNAEVSSYKDLGITTFNYYIRMEDLDNE